MIAYVQNQNVSATLVKKYVFLNVVIVKQHALAAQDGIIASALTKNPVLALAHLAQIEINVSFS